MVNFAVKMECHQAYNFYVRVFIGTLELQMLSIILFNEAPNLKRKL